LNDLLNKIKAKAEFDENNFSKNFLKEFSKPHSDELLSAVVEQKYGAKDENARLQPIITAQNEVIAELVAALTQAKQKLPRFSVHVPIGEEHIKYLLMNAEVDEALASAEARLKELV